LAGGPGKEVPLFLYVNGRISDEANIFPNTADSSNTYNPDSNPVPPWFNWN